MKSFLITTAALVILFLIIFGLVLLFYASIALRLPSPDELRGRAAAFKSAKVYDREGGLLYEVVDPQGGRRTVVHLDQISPYLRQATIATEDRNFYRHPGVDPLSIARAVWQNISQGEIVSGASTIPQQLARTVLLSPEERAQRTLARKIKEAILAAEISRRYPKDTILEIYLNEIYYGNLAYGIEAAAQTYFGKRAIDLNLAESALLAGLPQSPALYDPFTNPEAAKSRQAIVLNLMVEEGYITPARAQAARDEELHYIPQRADIRAPHFVTYVRQLLERKYGTDVLYRSGLQIRTTLDPTMQAIAERVAREGVTSLSGKHATNSALVAMRPDTGEILAMQGSVDFFDQTIDGQVNVALRLRQPGSSIKPITYMTAFEKGWTPATLIMDIETEFPDGTNPPYRPLNYDRQFHGPILMRIALGSSYNVPAVKALQFVGLPAMLEMAHRLGIRSLNRADYGLSLTLGGGDVTLLEMTSAYAVFANGGLRVPPVAVLRIEGSQGHVIEEYRPPQGQQVISPQHAYLITHILADNEARTPAFGPDSVLRLSRPAAAKTGTTDDWRDGWTIGYTPDLVAGVWVGNSDNTPMDHISGVRGAGPIWHNFMEEALRGGSPRDFPRPEGIETIEICADSGARPSRACPHQKLEIFAAGQGPLGPEHDIHQLIKIDRTTGQLATEFCPANVIEERYFQVYPPQYREWAERNGYPQPPTEPCSLHTGQAQVVIFQPGSGQVVEGVVSVIGHVQVADFSHYVVEYGLGPNPIGWGQVSPPNPVPVEGGLLAQWDTRGLRNGVHSLQVVAFDHRGGSVKAQVWIIVNNSSPTVAYTPSPTKFVLTEVPTFPSISIPTPTLVILTEEPTLTDTPTLVILTEEPMPTDTPTLVIPTEEPTPTDTSTLVIPTEETTPSDTPTEVPVEAPTVTPQETPIPSITLTPTDTFNATPEATPAELSEATPTG